MDVSCSGMVVGGFEEAFQSGIGQRRWWKRHPFFICFEAPTDGEN